jgi:hypothetical protein
MNRHLAGNAPFRIALLWHGDRQAREAASLDGSRFQATAEALRAHGIQPEPAIYSDDFVDDVREQLSKVDGVLVWVNPIENNRDRSVLDTLLRNVANQGVLVSAHPDIILKMGTKEVLVSTQAMSWGCDTHRYAAIGELRNELPARLAAGKPRVLKQYRGNGGNGVWKVEQHADPSLVRVRHALRGSVEEVMSLNTFLSQCETYFEGDGRIIDQEYQERLTDGMVRCYLVQDQVAGFGHQAINALFPASPGASPTDVPQPGPRLYYPPNTPGFESIKRKMEEEWIRDLCSTLDIERGSLPLIWDADFLYGPKNAAGEDTYVLCEINVSAVYPFPESALEPLAHATKEWLAKHKGIRVQED